MPKYDQLYKAKKPLLQMKILKSVASSGRLSQKEAITQFRFKPSTISDAFKTMKDRTKLIEISKHHDTLTKVEEGIRREKFYKLSSGGLLRFIEENPSPAEFWSAMIWYGFLNSKCASIDEFNICYSVFIERFVGTYPLRSCFFLGDFFEKLYLDLRKEYFDLRNDPTAAYIHTRGANTYKVLECLLLNRGITVDKIVKLTELAEEDVRDVIQDHSMTEDTYFQYIDDYETVYQSSRSEGTTIQFLKHLFIVPLKTQGKDEYYELSLLGVLLTLALISLRRQEESDTYVDYYNKTTLNYQEKLPLIFGKWELLEEILDFSSFPSIFDYLLRDYKSKSEILSLPLSLGGNKEIYDNIRSATLNTINKYFMVYEDGIRALESVDCPEESRNTAYYRLILEKINEIEMSLRYTELKSFGKYMKNKKSVKSNSVDISATFEDDLHFIEKALADEFSILFYVGLMRENSHKASDYPLTTDFIRSNPGRDCPKDFLDRIVARDVEIHDKLKGWISESETYQQEALNKMDNIYQGLNKEKKKDN
jgi:hypothetical protein